MDTPVLTKKQQKQSLSAKKGPIKGLRNVLAQPHDSYWPVVGQLDGMKLNSVLQQLLPALKRPLQRERKKRKKMVKKCSESKEESIQIEEQLPNKDLLNSIVLGINTVTRSLEKNQICCILLDADVEPPFLIRHIIMMAQIKKKPVLLLPSLKVLTSETIGFACAALALKNEVLSLDHHFYTLYENVSCISKNYPSKPSLQLFTSDTCFDCTMFENNETVEDTPKENPLNVDKGFVSLTNIYKFRSSCKERTFIPPNATRDLNVKKGADFISLDNDMDVSNSEDVQHTQKTRYFKPCLKKTSEFHNLQNKRNNYVNNNFTSSGISGNLRTESKKNRNFTGNDITYLPLKIKRLRGNSNRVKATKVSKKKKKNQRK